MVWGWMCIQEGALKQMLSSYGCYSCRYRVRGHCQGTRSGGSEALEVSVAVEATAVWSRQRSICEYCYRVTVSTVLLTRSSIEPFPAPPTYGTMVSLIYD